MWRRSADIQMLRWWRQWWGWWKVLGWWVMMGRGAPRINFWREWNEGRFWCKRPKKGSPYTVNSEDTVEHLRWRLN
jgi:hypothetical protein